MRDDERHDAQGAGYIHDMLSESLGASESSAVTNLLWVSVVSVNSGSGEDSVGLLVSLRSLGSFEV